MVDRLKPEHKITTICKVINLSPRTYHANKKRTLSKREIFNQFVRRNILEIYHKSDKRFGAYKINNKLKEQGINISIGKLYRILSNMQLPSVYTKKPQFKYYKSDNDIKYTNILKRNFHTEAPNKVWVSDITYVKVNGKNNFVCIVLDLFSRKIVSYTCSSNMKKELVIETLSKAMRNRHYPKNVIFHSDRGSQYTSKDFRRLIDSYDIVQSFSKAGCPYDNAVAEAFFKYYKQGETNRRSYRTLDELKLATFEYVEKYYNNYNPHSHNGGRTPNQTEKDFWAA